MIEIQVQMSKPQKKSKTVKKYVMNEKHDAKRISMGKENCKKPDKSPKYDEKRTEKRKTCQQKCKNQQR